MIKSPIDNVINLVGVSMESTIYQLIPSEILLQTINNFYLFYILITCKSCALEKMKCIDNNIQ